MAKQDPIDELLKNERVKKYIETIARNTGKSESEVIKAELRNNNGENFKRIISETKAGYEKELKEATKPGYWERKTQLDSDLKKKRDARIAQEAIDSKNKKPESRPTYDELRKKGGEEARKERDWEGGVGKMGEKKPDWEGDVAGGVLNEDKKKKELEKEQIKRAKQVYGNDPSLGSGLPTGYNTIKATIKGAVSVANKIDDAVGSAANSIRLEQIKRKYAEGGDDALDPIEKLILADSKKPKSTTPKTAATPSAEKDLGRTTDYTDAQIDAIAGNLYKDLVKNGFQDKYSFDDLTPSLFKQGIKNTEIDRIRTSLTKMVSTGGNSTGNTQATGLNRPNTKVAAPTGTKTGTTSKSAAQQAIAGIPLIQVDPMPALTPEQSKAAADLAEQNRQKALTASGVPETLTNNRPATTDTEFEKRKQPGFEFGVGEAAAAAQLAIGLTGADKYSKLSKKLIDKMPKDSIPIEATKAYNDSQIAANNMLTRSQMGLDAAKKAELEAKIERVYASDSQISPMVRRLATQKKYDALIGLSSFDEQTRSENEMKYLRTLEGANGEAARISAYKRGLFEDDRKKWEIEFNRALQGEAAGAATTQAGLSNLVQTIQIKEMERNRKQPTFNLYTG